MGAEGEALVIGVVGEVTVGVAQVVVAAVAVVVVVAAVVGRFGTRLSARTSSTAS
jgi:hypothetical protein